MWHSDKKEVTSGSGIHATQVEDPLRFHFIENLESDWSIGSCEMPE